MRIRFPNLEIVILFGPDFYISGLEEIVRIRDRYFRIGRGLYIYVTRRRRIIISGRLRRSQTVRYKT